MGILTPLLSWCLLILVIEIAFWGLFRRKIMQICLPIHGDAIFFHFFTVWRLRLFAIVHTVALILCVIIGHLLLWP
ncbi:MAG TPA: hypothetical protein DEB30_02490 [Candidatus Peribacter riflensis]|nr:MAG: hypothetical protein A2398_02885 [Candidatus Peribacteria bacterium RIFOXYB1_FULL_57_12]HBH20360.1 hypothetical protein [Candidatus Peribacter riflensis]HBU09647.1 hypothetical protein [Candidatus Peribacter riflensis]